MRVVLAIAIAAAAAALVLTSASAGSPPQFPFHIATAHARPIVGKHFTGITVTYIATPIAQVQCHASIGGKKLPGREQRFYSAGISGPAAISCGWQIPKATAGKLLEAWARAFTPDGGFYSGGHLASRVKP